MRSNSTWSSLTAVLLSTLALAVAAPRAAAAQCTARYYGGPVVSNVRVVQVNWGTGIDATVDAGLAGFYGTILDSAYLDWLVEYDTAGKTGYVDGLAGSNQAISRGTFGGRYVITPGVTAASITDAQIGAELAAQIAAGHLPAPQTDGQGYVNTLYMVEFPSSITVTEPGGGVSCVQFCAYHSSLSVGGKEVAYGVLPDAFNGACSGGCGTGAALDVATTVHSHQIIEAITDPQIGLFVRNGGASVGRPIAWYADQNSCGEIGDICNAQQALVAGYTVQKEWSQRLNACIAAASTTIPICTGTNGPTCRRCVTADEGRSDGCTGATPVCDATSTSPTYGQCVASPPAPPHKSGGCSSAGLAETGPLGLVLAFLALGALRRRSGPAR